LLVPLVSVEFTAHTYTHPPVNPEMSMKPFADVTNTRMSMANRMSSKPLAPLAPVAEVSPLRIAESPSPSPVRTYRHDPYNWDCLPAQPAAVATVSAVDILFRQQEAYLKQLLLATAARPPLTSMLSLLALAPQIPAVPQAVTPSAVPAMINIPLPPQDAAKERETTSLETAGPRAAVQFRCHQAEYSASLALEKGQYVVVQGDRGIDVGIVLRYPVEDRAEVQPVAGSVLRHATQREVDYWNNDLKADEAAALEYCRQKSSKLQLPMEMKHAEFQFDKKKLTFYYEAKERVNFVSMLKELFREYTCRIWMEKVRSPGE
jgi:hypothetical protein